MRDDHEKACCTPSRATAPTAPAVRPARDAAQTPDAFDAVPIPGGKALIGTDDPLIPDDGEGPLRTKSVKPFRLMRATVTNAQFAHFVDATGHVTDAERFGWSFVFHRDVPGSLGATPLVPETDWWRGVRGATWRDPHGPGTGAASLPDRPVTHVSWTDAKAFAAWCGGRLPTELEWEHAARGSLGDVRFPWGMEEPDESAFTPCNIWQGGFPDHDTGADGWTGPAPADAFAPNGYGLHQMVGNVWEWTADAYRVKSLKKHVRRKLDAMRGFRVLKGGSYLCHRSYCYRYRIAARTGNSPDTSTAHQGFRIAWDGV